MNNIQINFSEFIQIHNNQTITTSEFIAKAFNKNHKDVLRKIDEILTQVPDFFGKRNFTPTENSYKNNLGFDVPNRAYKLTKDGFMLLVMGFTGKQAMQIKIAYIEAFNAMAETLVKQNSGSLKSTSSVEHLKGMPTRDELWNLFLTLMDIFKDVNGWFDGNFNDWVSKNNPRGVLSDKLTYQELLSIIRKMHATLCNKYHHHPLQNFYKHTTDTPMLPQPSKSKSEYDKLRENFKIVLNQLAKMNYYAGRYAQFQDAIVQSHQKQNNNMAETIHHYFGSDITMPQEGFLFIFKANIWRDINEVNNLLNRHKDMLI